MKTFVAEQSKLYSHLPPHEWVIQIQILLYGAFSLLKTLKIPGVLDKNYTV